MHAISSYHDNRPTNTRRPPARCKRPQTGPIKIHCVAKLSVQCNYNIKQKKQKKAKSAKPRPKTHLVYFEHENCTWRQYSLHKKTKRKWQNGVPAFIKVAEHHSSAFHSPLIWCACGNLLKMEMREDCCSVCRRSGELLMCDVCSLVYHLQCLDPPLSSVPVGLWSCPKCQVRLW